MRRLLPATALALAVGLALPAVAQTGGPGGSGASGGGGSTGGASPSTGASPSGDPTGTSPSGASPSPDGSQSRGTQSNPDGRFSGGPSTRQRGDEDDRSQGRGQQAETQRCVSKFLALDKNGDGMLSENEYGRIRRSARDVDRDHDGRINRSEIRDACASGTLTERDLRG